MSHSNHTVLCGTCKCAVETVSDPQAHDKVTCPRCGASDRFDNVMATVKEHVVYLAQKTLSESLAKVARSSRFLKVTTKHVPNRSFRWVIEGGL